MTYNKEAIYDEQINPLMAQIQDICRTNGIHMLASFALIDQDPNYHNQPMVCTSTTPGDTFNHPRLVQALNTIYWPHYDE